MGRASSLVCAPLAFPAHFRLPAQRAKQISVRPFKGVKAQRFRDTARRLGAISRLRKSDKTCSQTFIVNFLLPRIVSGDEPGYRRDKRLFIISSNILW